MKWPPRPPLKRFHVKVKPLKLQGLPFRTDDDREDEEGGGVCKKAMVLVIEIVWKGGSKSGLVPFYKSSSKHKRNRSSQRIVGIGKSSVEWDDDDNNNEFDHLCDISTVPKAPWDVVFKVLHGKKNNNGDKRSKLTAIGKVSLDLTELVSETECSEIERQLPITLNVDSAVIEATLFVVLSIVEVRAPPSETGGGDIQNSTESNKEDGFFKMVRVLTQRQNKNKNNNNKKIIKKKHKEKNQPSPSWCDSDDQSLIFDSDGLLGNESSTTTTTTSGSLGGSSLSSEDLNLGTELDSAQSLESTQLEPSQNHMVRLFSWKNRRLSFRSFRKKPEPPQLVDQPHPPQPSPAVDSPDCQSCWQVKELMSRDGGARLKANIFFASFDQRSERAAGESACTALVAVIAHWLHSNRNSMPTRLELDSLIAQGSLEWRKLCDNEEYSDSFPDKHFDLETVLEANLRPLSVLRSKSFTGFFSPDKFECLNGVMSFDEIWNEISYDRDDRVYIVSWNDHFFVLKVESDAYYIIDSLGERLFEGCKQAYMLKFDDSSLMYELEKKKKKLASEGNEEDGEIIICSGKECCREYIKRFLAAITVRELEEEEKKGTTCTFSLHQRLQIDFHYSSSSSSFSSTCSSSATSSSTDLDT